jgi:hypothetical protein
VLCFADYSLRDMIVAPMKPKTKKMDITDEQTRSASEDVAWEYVALLAAALEIVKPADTPANHVAQDAFLVHVRNLAEFFWRGVKNFDPAVPIQRDDENHDDIYAVDFCSEPRWCARPFGDLKFGDTKLIWAINKTLSHMTYSRRLPCLPSQIDVVFDAHKHVHGTFELIRQTWENFLESISPKFLSLSAQKTSRFGSDSTRTIGR